MSPEAAHLHLASVAHLGLIAVSLVLRIYWDLDIQTNVVIREQPPTNHLPPNPEIELQRAQLVTKLRQHYHELCLQREGISHPENTFNENSILAAACQWVWAFPSVCECGA